MSPGRPFDSRGNGRSRALADLADHAPRPQTANWKGQFDGVEEGGGERRMPEGMQSEDHG